MTPRKVLLLEDDPRVQEAIRSEVGAQFEVLVAQNYTEALDFLYRTPDLVAVIAHHNVRHGGGGARFMVEAARVCPSARRILYSTSAAAAADAVTFGHAFLRRPWLAGDLLATLRTNLGVVAGATG